jgi:hypothetical protein
MIKNFNYYLTGTGWAEVFFSNDNQNIRFEFSYLSDPLLELFQGLCRLINNQSDTEKIVFAEEPGEHSLVFSKQDKETIKVEIFWSDEWETVNNALKTSSNKETVYSDKDTLANFASAICLGIDSLLDRMTLAEYKEKWNLSEFPIESYNKLREARKLA